MPPNDENILFLDISRIPSGPEIILETLTYGESAKYALNIENADKATLENAPNGIEITKENDAFYLIADGSIAMTGGVVGFNDGGRLTRCYNSGKVEGMSFKGEYPPGSIIHLLGIGKVVSYCYFEKGSASIDAMVYNGGILLDLKPID